MRPLYETETDLIKEAAIAASIESVWRCRLQKLAIKYSLDYAMLEPDSDRVRAFCELKTRNYTMQKIGEFGGYLLSLGKWNAAMTLCQSTNLPFILFVNATDGLWYTKVYGFTPDAVHLRGRTDRGDPQDVEPCVLLNVDRFTQVLQT